ncbi:uncharacterized protein LOC108208794 isoform X2 [Daucus carota subsp. sativus]|uniref:uncharacterized protein LOC108208794 isoform X2 n=1 Tax=Daucus carota subsp. sativus TaxID=79200 RepID=UPI0007F02042|nr:PREDICTED: uncharacterized protein LOC108208794 isoform X2 [Daucus carota subsp. sativus]
MPPELLPRDRKELFRERKNERSLSEGGGSNRWRDVKRPGGYVRGFPMLSEESCRGSGPSRSNDKMLDDESGRSLGKYGRSGRENRGGPFSQRGLNRHSSDAAANSSLNGPIMQFNVNDKRLVDDVLTCNRIDLKDTPDKSGGVSGPCTGQKLDGENSLSSIDWKTLKWTRSGSLSSRGSGLSHSSSSKSMGGDSTETKSNLHPLNVSPLESPSCDAAAFASPAAGANSAAPTEETSSRKKPRLGWGEGLAKFEKKRVDSPSDTAVKIGMVLSENNTENGRSHVINVPDRSPRLAGLLSCTSPATPSVACSSSVGLNDKFLGKAVNVETADVCGSPLESLNQCEDLSCNPVTLEDTLVANLYQINELLKCNDQVSTDSDFVKSTVMNKLLVLKADVSKRIEATESEIDSLENELKLLINDTGSVHPRPASSSSLPVVCFNKPSEVDTASNLIPRPDPLQTSGDLLKDRTYGGSEGELAECKDEDIDSPGTATSKFCEPMYSGKPVSQADIPNLVESSLNVDACRNGSEVKSLVYAVEEEGTDTRPSCLVDPDNVGQTENVYDLMMASNKEAAHRASEVFSKLVPDSSSSFDIQIDDNSPCLKVDPSVEEKFARRKRFMKFKERVITLKFRVFQHLWKEDLRLLSIKRSRTKPQKKFEFGTRMLPCGYQKHRASIRSRFSSPGNLSLVPTTQVIDFASKLLEDSRTKVYRSALNMPSLILDNKEKIMSRFISSNRLVEDPCSLETERCIINPWTSEEKEIFLDKLSVFGKDFRKIAAFLDNKTTADCVEFYYKNHKSECFQKAKKKPEFAEKGKSFSKNTYLVTSGKRWNRDDNVASLDLLGAASAIAAKDDGLKPQKCAPRLIFSSCNSRTARGDDVLSKRSSAINILGSERENVAADVLAGICGSLSSEAMSSCITSSVDIGEGYQERKGQPMRMKKRRSVTPEVAQDVDEGICSDESCGEVDHADWTDEERSVFIEAVSSYGKDFAMISQCVGTKSSNQCKVFFSKARKCLGLDMMHPGSCSGVASLSDNGNGGGGADTEDASLVETGSGVKSGSKTDEDLSLSSTKVVQTETFPAGTINIYPDADKLKEINGAGESDVIVDEPRPEDAVSAGSKNKNVCLVLDNDNRFETCDGSESGAVKNLENGLGPHTKTIQNEASEGKQAVVQEVSGFVKPSYANLESGVYGDNSRAGEAGSEFSSHGNSFNETGLKNAPLSDGNIPVSAGTDLLATGSLPGCEKINPIILDDAPFSVLQTPVVQDPGAVQAENSLNLTSHLVPGKISNSQLKISVNSKDGYDKPLYQPPSRDDINPLNSLQAYPPSVPTKKALNGDIGSCKSTPSQSISKVDRNHYTDLLLPRDSYLPKSNGHGPKHNEIRSEHHLLSQDQLNDNSRRPRPRCLSDSDQPTRKGDVKLFGQILSHPSTQQKPNSRAEEKEDRDAKHAKSSENSYNLKIPSQNLDGILTSTKFDHNSYLGLRDMGLPMRSFGFWDGNRIQTGFPSMPDSAILLAKYPAAFGNYPPSSSTVEHQHLNRITERNLNGVSVMPARELSSSKGVADYQAYMNRDGAKVQPFAVDLKQQQTRYYSEMQRQRRGSEYDGLPSVQQQRAMVGLEVLGRGGILHGGGGPRNTVSDPVAAIRRHYAGEQYNGQIGSIIREEAWRSNGNVGR